VAHHSLDLFSPRRGKHAFVDFELLKLLFMKVKSNKLYHLQCNLFTLNASVPH